MPKLPEIQKTTKNLLVGVIFVVVVLIALTFLTFFKNLIPQSNSVSSNKTASKSSIAKVATSSTKIGDNYAVDGMVVSVDSASNSLKVLENNSKKTYTVKITSQTKLTRNIPAGVELDKNTQKLKQIPGSVVTIKLSDLGKNEPIRVLSKEDPSKKSTLEASEILAII